jgi:aldehyde:ferredoxin oxidoreductase
MQITKSQLLEIGERITTIERMFNIREGFSRKDDNLPERFYKEPTPLGFPIVKGKTIDQQKFERMIDEYYDLHGWDNDGVPTIDTLQKLDLKNGGI